MSSKDVRCQIPDNKKIESLLLNRKWQKGIITCLILVNVSMIALGMYALKVSPVLLLDLTPSISGQTIQKIEGINIPPSFFYRLPEFYFPDEEYRWWQMQTHIYRILQEKDFPLVEIMTENGKLNIKARLGKISLHDVVQKTGLIYLTALVYIIAAVSVFKRQHSEPGAILSLFLLSGSLYLTSAAPVVTRDITLPPLYFKLLIIINYIAGGGLITLVHFSIIFPEPKEIIKRYPVIPYIAFYGYFLIMTVLYLTGVIAYATSTPFLLIWTFLMISAFIHSIIKEKDVFLRKQISLSLLAPLMVAVIFILFQILPGILGTTAMRFTYFALFSLIIPFALPSALDNSRLYRERIEAERTIQRERERIRQELHDSIMNNLAGISISSEVSLSYLDRDTGIARENLEFIKNTAVDTSRQIRGLLRVTDDRCKNWEEFCGYLRKYGYAMVKDLDLDFDINISDNLLAFELPPVSIRACLYHVFREAMINIIKHAGADRADVVFSLNGPRLIFEIRDNGRGADLDNIKEGHYGIRNMKKRVEDVGGIFNIESKHSEGTRILIQIPLR